MSNQYTLLSVSMSHIGKMAKKTRRTVDDIFDDLDNIGKRKPSMAELYPEEFDPVPEATSAPHVNDNSFSDITSPPNRKQPRLDGGSASTVAVTPTPRHVIGSAKHTSGRIGSADAAAVTPFTVCGSSPTVSEATFSVDSSPAFASELTTKHRKAEETADLAVFLADSLSTSPTTEGLQQLVKHLVVNGARYVVRSLRIAGLLRQFMKGYVNDIKYAHQRSKEYQQIYLALLSTLVGHVPHDAVPLDDVFKRLVALLSPDGTPSIAEPSTGQIDVARVKPAHSGGLAASAALAALKKRAAAPTVVNQKPPQDAAATVMVWLSSSVQQVTAELDHASASSQQYLSDSQPQAADGDIESSSVAEDPKSVSCEAWVLRICTQLLLSYNNQAQLQLDGFTVRSLSNVISKSASILFVEAGGVAALVQFVSRNQCLPVGAGALLAAFRLLVLVTCDGDIGVAAKHDKALLEVFCPVVDFAMDYAFDWLQHWQRGSVLDTTHGEVAFEALRVVINLTSVIPQLVPTSADSAWLMKACQWTKHYVSRLDSNCDEPVSEDDDLYDQVTLSICVAINLLRKGTNAAAVSALTSSEESPGGSPCSLVQHAANVMVRWYESTDTRQSVISGYLAMMLACISLSPSEGSDCGSHRDARVAVITAITRSLNSKANLSFDDSQRSPENSQPGDTDCGNSPTVDSVASWRKEKQLRAKPMTLVVAILQEFVMFQSSAGILTKEVLISMHSVVEMLIKQNQIVVAKGGE